MNQDLSDLKKELIQEFSLEGMDLAKQEELLGKMLEALLKRIFVETMEKLGEENLAAYSSLIDRGAPEEEVSRFLESKIPNYEAFVRSVIEDFKQGMKTAAAAQ